ncbi:MAG: hypothetical protein AAGF74_00880 [Pseudomonadota bacterium]
MDREQSNEILTQTAAQLGRDLGLDGPIPVQAAQRALLDPDYVRAVLAVRFIPRLRDQFLNNPETARVRGKADRSIPADPKRSSAAIATKAAGAVLKWGMDGLEVAQPWVIERRLAACNACEFNAPAPDSLLYRGAKVVVGQDAKICTKCDCLTNTKAAISSENCPEKDPKDPTMSKWQEPWKEDTRQAWIWGNDNHSGRG